MSEVCELVPSQKGNNKINVRGYLMLKERNRDEYYWCCERRKSEAGQQLYYVIICTILLIFAAHKHAPQATSASVARAVKEVKKRAREMREKPILDKLRPVTSPQHF